MPNYTYRCPYCRITKEFRNPMADRNRVCYCIDCDRYTMRRIPDAPGFTVTGFNAKNGYSNERTS